MFCRLLPSYLKTNKPILIPIGTSLPRDKGMKQSILGSGGQRSRSPDANDRLLRSTVNFLLCFMWWIKLCARHLLSVCYAFYSNRLVLRV